MTRVGPTRRAGDCDTSVGTAEGRDDGKKHRKKIYRRNSEQTRVGTRDPIVDTRQGQMREKQIQEEGDF